MRLSEDQSKLLQIARISLSGAASSESMLWNGIDASDPEERRYGDFELLERIGQGGMGVVYRARQISLDRDVAIKFIVGTLADNARAIATFAAEARAAARLHHPNIVPVFETGRVEGLYYFSMPLLRGQTLAQRLDRAPMPVPEIVKLMSTLCAAVAYAHSLGLLHLDLKPGNILFDEHDQTQIGDFGLARHMDADGIVLAQESAGTAAYMAPEQRAAGAQRLQKATDVYALGAILYELLVGHPPGAVNPQSDALQPDAMIPAPCHFDKAINPDLAAICGHCLHAEPAQRYPDASALAADLIRLRDGNSVSVREPSWRERGLRVARRRPRLVLVASMMLVSLLLGLLTTSWQWRRAELARAEADRQQLTAYTEARRKQQLAGFMAAAFPAGSAIVGGRSESARAAVSWLKQNLGDDPAGQRAVLSAFRAALDQADKGDVVKALTSEIFDQLGESYRDDQVRRLAAKSDRDSLIAATLIGLPRGEQSLSPRHAEVRQKLLERYPEDVLARYTAALACHVQTEPCTRPEYFASLVAQFPDNAAHWVLFPAGNSPDAAELTAHILRAGAAGQFSDHLPELLSIVELALREQAVPASVLEPLRALLDEPEAQPSLQRNALDSVALPQYAAFMQACKPENPAMQRAKALHDACGAFARAGMHSAEASVLARMVSSVMLRRLYPDSPIAQAAKDLRRQYLWLAEHAKPELAGDTRFRADLIQFGEWEALQRGAERSGGSRTPASDWQPADPQALMLPEQREAVPPSP